MSEPSDNALIRAINDDAFDDFVAAIDVNSEDPLLALKYLPNGYTPLQYCAQRDSIHILQFLNN